MVAEGPYVVRIDREQSPMERAWAHTQCDQCGLSWSATGLHAYLSDGTWLCHPCDVIRMNGRLNA